VVFDEPTTALDVTTQIEVLAAFKKVIRELGTTAVYVSHDLAVVAQMADRIVVLNGGAVKENGVVAQVLDAPVDAYTRQLLAATRRPEAELETPKNLGKHIPPLLEIRGLSAGYGRIDRFGNPAVRVLDDVSLSIPRGSTLGVIGESGSGKTTLARVVAGLVDRAGGEVLFDGKPLPAQLSRRTPEQYRQIQIVFQNADTALNPSHSIADILGRPLAFYHHLSGSAAKKRMLELLDLVKLPASIATRTPAGLSGGQKQRVNLARALAANPALILCDEVTSALDTVVGAAILDLLAELRRELGRVVHVHQPRYLDRARDLRRSDRAVRGAVAWKPGSASARGAAVSPVHGIAGRLGARLETGLARCTPRDRLCRVAGDGRERGYSRVVRVPRALPGAHRRNVQYDAAVPEKTAFGRGDSLPSSRRRVESLADRRGNPGMNGRFVRLAETGRKTFPITVTASCASRRGRHLMVAC
jgi:ATPase components of various ABC-type transport systems, contain duplicated ATPase